MTVMIRYKTSYIVNRKESFILSFAFGNDASLRCVLGLLALLAIGASIGLASSLLSCTELNREFPLDLQPLDKGLPEGDILNHYTNTIPHTFSTKLLHHTSTDGSYHLICHSTPSDNIHVTNHLKKYEVLRKFIVYSS